MAKHNPGYRAVKPMSKEVGDPVGDGICDPSFSDRLASLRGSDKITRQASLTEATVDFAIKNA